jgi:deoxyhypusine synthase
MHPGRNREPLRRKRDRLLERLRQEGAIDSLTCALARLEPLPDKPLPLPREAPHLLERLAAGTGPGLERIARPPAAAIWHTTLYHDLHYALNFTLHRGSPFVDDVQLYEDGVIRIYDVLFPATVLLETDAYVRDFLVRSGLDGPVSTAELHYALGRDLIERQPGCEQYSVLAAAAAVGVPIYTSSPGDSSIGMNVAYHELMNGSGLMVDPNRDVNDVCAFILAARKNGCVILGGGSPKNFYLQGQPTLWEVYGIPKGGNDYFIQITTDQVVWGGLSGATPAEAVSWGKVNPGVLPDTAVAYVDSTIGFPLFCEYVVGSELSRRPRKELVHQRERLVSELKQEALARRATHTEG